MPKKQTDAGAVGAKNAALDTAKMVEVRALSDSPVHGLVAGRLASVPAPLVAELKAMALVDDHPEAVAYARSLEPAEGETPAA